MSVGKIRVELELDDKNFTVRTQRAGKTVKELKRNLDQTAKSVKNVEKAVSGWLPKLRDVAITVSILKNGVHNLAMGMFGWQHAIIKSNAEIERMTMLMRGMSKETSIAAKQIEAASNVDFVIDLAQNAPFQLQELTNSFVKFKSVGVDPTNGSLKSLTDAVAAFGGNDQILHRASVAIQQMAGKGVISMEELRQQLGEAVPNAITLMARSLGYSYQELVDKVSRGQIKSKVALAKMFKEFEFEFGGASERMMTTWNGMVQRLQTRWELFKVEIGKSGYFQEVKDVLEEIVNAFGTEQMKVVADNIGQALLAVTKALKRAVDVVREYWDWIKFATVALVKFRIALMVFRTIQKFTTATKAMGLASILAGGQVALLGKQAQFVGPHIGSATLATRKLTASLKLLKGVLMTNIFGLLLTGLAYVAGEAFLASEEIKDFRANLGKLTENNGLGATAEDATRLREEITRLNTAIRRDTAEADSFARRGMVNTAKHIEERVRENQRLLKLAESDLAAAQVGIARQAADRILEDRKHALTQEIDAAKSAYREIEAFNFKQLEDGIIGYEEYQKRRADIRNRAMIAERTMLMNEQEKIQARLESAGPMRQGQREALEAQLKSVQEQILRTNESYAEFLKLKSQSAEMSNEDKKIAIGNKRAETLLTNLKAKVAELKAENIQPGAKGYVENLMEKIKAGNFGDDKDKLEQILSLAREIQAVSADTKAQEQASKLAKQVDDLKIKLGLATAEVFTFERALESGKFGDPTALTKQRIEELRGLFNELSDLEWEEEVRKDFEKVEQSFQSLNNTLYDGIVDANDALGKRTDVIQQQFQRQAAIYRAQIENAQFNDRQRRNLEESYYKWYVAQQKRIARETEHPVMKLARDWEQATERMKKAQASWIDDMSKRLTDFVMTGKFDFNDFANAVIEDIIRIRMQEAMSKIIGGILGGFGGFSLSGMDGVNFGSQQDMMLAAQNFANGGIMTPWGTAQLKQYATGGIATSPQVSVFGEGDTPEAYVPLPDGRTIPVTMNGEGGGATSVQVNVINQSGQNVDAKQGQPRFDGEKMVLDVVLSAVSRPGKFRDSMKGALS